MKIVIVLSFMYCYEQDYIYFFIQIYNIFTVYIVSQRRSMKRAKSLLRLFHSVEYRSLPFINFFLKLLSPGFVLATSFKLS